MPRRSGSGCGTNSALARSAAGVTLNPSEKGNSTVEAVFTSSSGLRFVKYFFSFQFLTTAPLLENVTSYTPVSIVKSSSFCAAAAGAAGLSVAGSTVIDATAVGFFPSAGGAPWPDFGGTVSVFFAGGFEDWKKYGVV